MTLSIQSGSLLILVSAVLTFFPPTANAQWDDRSDEVWDEFDSGNNTTTWILMGAGTALATAAIVYTVKKRRAAKRGEEKKTEQEEEANAAHSFSPTPSRLHQLAEVQRQLPVHVLMGVPPSEQRPIIGVTVRF